MRRLYLLACLALAACSTGAPVQPPAPPAPVPILSAVWQAPMGILASCGGDPFSCSATPGAVWGVLPGGDACDDPEPNGCYSPSNGLLYYHAGDPGMGLISTLQVDRTKMISVQAIVTAQDDCTSPVSFVGPVIYDGEGVAEGEHGNYRALYISCGAGTGYPNPLAFVLGQTTSAPPNQTIIAPGSTHTLRIDYVPGVTFTYYVDGQVILVETPGSWTPGTFDFAQDPHIGLWFGNSIGWVGQFDVYSGVERP